jgi:hypothetical protein
MSKMKNGRMPLSQKSTEVVAEAELNMLALDPALKRELAEKGYAYRFISAPEYQKNYGFHRTGWKPYKREETTEKKGTLDFGFGVDPEGYIRRGELVLAVKPLAEHAKHKAKLAAKTKLYNNHVKQTADLIRQGAREAGVNMKVEEGFEESASDDQE